VTAPKRPDLINLRISDEERVRFERVAAHHGLTVSSTIRMLVKWEEARIAADLLRSPAVELSYRSFVPVEDLESGQCTVHRAADSHGARWWLLWFRVPREDRPGELVDLAVPVAPNGSYAEKGAGGRTWGLASVGAGRWQVAPSVDVKVDRKAVPGHAQDPARTMWHQTPTLVGVPDGEAWQTAAP
jgi:hypothetical protein